MFKEGTQRGRCQQVKNQREERWVQVKERINPVSGRNHEMDQDRHTISASARSFLLHRPWHIFSIFSKQRAYLEGTVPDPLVSWRHDCEASFASNFNTDIGVFVGAEFFTKTCDYLQSLCWPWPSWSSIYSDSCLPWCPWAARGYVSWKGEKVLRQEINCAIVKIDVQQSL